MLFQSYLCGIVDVRIFHVMNLMTGRHSVLFPITTTSAGEELKESWQHFVLFPIQYHEVQVVSHAFIFPLLLTIINLADVIVDLLLSDEDCFILVPSPT